MQAHNNVRIVGGLIIGEAAVQAGIISPILVKLKSFGVPYVSPAVPYRLSDWKDFMVRMPLMMMKRRPKMMYTKDPTRKG